MSRTNQGRSHYNFGLPLHFIYNGLIYSKEFDGNYHSFPVDKPRIKANRLSTITQSQAEEFITNSAYIQTILFIVNNDQADLKL